MSLSLFLVQYVSTLFMTGLIWFVQIVHYPLFSVIQAHISASDFRRYEDQHATRTGWVVFPPMAVELASAFAALFPRLRPVFLSRNASVASAALVLLIWASTGVIQVPLHNRLSKNASESLIRSLVLSNWIRTTLWTARAVLLTVYLLRALC